MNRTSTYKEQSRIFLSQAFEELARGDLAQASEKGWGAAAKMVKAIAEDRGWMHRSHRALHHAVDRFYLETADSELRRLFRHANSLHVNFYEDTFTAHSIDMHLRNVERFVDKAEGLPGASA